MSLQYVIDGYNVINHPRFIQLVPKGSPDKRRALLDLIKINNLSGSPRNKVTVCFDGYANYKDTAVLSDNYTGIKVIFSCDESADDRIIKIVESAQNPKVTIVVSDDNQIRLAAKLFKVKALSVGEFLEAKDRAPDKKEEDAKPGLNYSQIHDINQELKKLWLK